MPTAKSVFSFRAECSVDVRRFLAGLTEVGIAAEASQSPVSGVPGPDVAVELQASATLEQLRLVARRVEDCHVIVQTLRALPVAENSLERDLAYA